MIREGFLAPPDPINGQFVQRFLEFHYENGAQKDVVEPYESHLHSLKDLIDILEFISNAYQLESDDEDLLLPFTRKGTAAYPFTLSNLDSYGGVAELFNLKNSTYRRNLGKAEEICFWMKDKDYPGMICPVGGISYSDDGFEYMGESRARLPHFTLWYRIPLRQLKYFIRFFRRYRDNIEEYLLPISCDTYRTIGYVPAVSSILKYDNTLLE